ncbi:MAG: Non-canonical purine NTP pyrophosphatase [Alphaproteobacteria bacterium ADurb.BinA280]|jgi:XTP/dITP diphosphohydrolase|nr:RdgB/HAM1 family non-canonical purine NTP pyrophosphatase [Xanthomonadales bacterium]OPZ11833.1 MAG: Non-canonical purine NTP pyrophosphatase [Alphaproteobacteria bacterium ADurb.BinA280]
MPPEFTRLVLASGNAGKLAELRALLADSGIELIASHDLGIADPEETGRTFVENALIKARNAAAHSGLPALADDSGLCIDALNGAPGLISAHYAGEHGNHSANIARVLHELRAVEESARSAYFISVLALLRHADDPAPLLAEGRWHGRILPSPRGSDGFGYDPIFLDPSQGLSAAELPAAEKNRVSHRGQALRVLRQLLHGLPRLS